ncbi:hypothetical protein MPK67_gp087 [Erwinia phage pEa_SNUABM_32]|uniref:Uncharacterized protein n=2 Tax=Alexandravirus TaxID=2733088 RepID=A0AAE7XJS5_9CAUD|nr:hypothetical protein MPK67_gp087 [Erwinia phage pEa_SNUABM_32]YP_010301200.1 hypothetical protein MPK68_gp087 [Erwinia phage pEa_SNUABM_3]QZE56623.1 hypothetical protein pEaSNUABM20_00087 [Erwinia phage pEa_SNUABM_20]QZE58303.1 hypothetical protein pEaSNUABM40_00087 [Erwinia phage pEa_SNUABM_40]UAW52868.1 hypothetical protein pEaSNUABM23_00086 [Erwinia phage pEa_SNUABM_23]UIW10764.1 hypothetical protein pEaSNUABM23_00086 [Erwinia phage pEa_SNUABM_31]QZE56284.1 hypothetical protein pEaSNUAB
MFVPVIAYDPDLFADFVFVMSQIEISTNSQPSKPMTNEKAALHPAERVADTVTLAIQAYRWSQILNQQVSSSDSIVLVPAGVNQVQSKFTPRNFASNPGKSRIDVPIATGSFVTDQTIEPLFDNIVFRVSVPQLDLSDTKANNKSVAPVVS